MTIPTVFESCRPRADVLAGAVTDADFAADLAQVICGKGSDDYVDPTRFFSNTHPTRGLKNLLANVCSRLSGAGGEAASIFRLDTSYGGGKSHALIALCHAARAGADVPGIEEFIDRALLPRGNVRVAAFDGENADPANGRRMESGHLAYTPWGEIASALAGSEGYERVRESDERRIAPGAETLRELFAGEATLILLDELSVYLRKVSKFDNGGEQLTAFLTSLCKAVEGAPNAVLVYTLAIGKDGLATDAYNAENQRIADRMAEAGSVSARKATLLNPTEEDETIEVLRRRLFESIDEQAAANAEDAYRLLWNTHRDALPEAATRPETAAAFRSSYPFHPEVLETLTAKTATLENFQRVRGMLRLLARTVSHLWERGPTDATAIHLHHIDPGHEPIRQEIVTRLGQSRFSPAISRDVSAGLAGQPALAEELDARHHGGLPPFASYVARTVFMQTLAFNEPLKGVSPERLRYSVLGPALEIGFVEEARKKFLAESAYLDDRPGVPMRFLAEANLHQFIRRSEEHVDAGEMRAELHDRIRHIFVGDTLDAVPFPGGPFDVADEVADGRPKLVVLGYEAVTVGDTVDQVPELIERIFARKGAEGSALRTLRNNLVFVAADDSRKGDMQHKARRRLALRGLKKPERLADLAEHQQAQVLELEQRSEQELALAIQQCYRHVFYPSRNRVGTSDVDLAHTAIDTHSASDRPGAGQQQVVRTLRDLRKLRLPEDEPDSPAYVRDRTPLKKGQITVLSLREEFRRDPALPMLAGDDLFVRGVRRGCEQGEYVYQRGGLLFGKGDPPVTIEIDEQSIIFTMSYAREKELWPRQQATRGSPRKDIENAGKEYGTGAADGTKTTAKREGRPDEDRAPQAGHGAFAAEGVLREALVRLWEQVRGSKFEAVAELQIRMYEAGDAFRLLRAVGAISGADKIVKLEGGYETRDDGSFQLEFRGPVEDAKPVCEFLGPQLRQASDSHIKASFALSFEEGLSMQGNAAEQLTEQFSRFASGAAHVSATAKAKV